jgi:predicted RNase H-like nuclease
MNFIGVDACKKGWFAVSINYSVESCEIGIFETFGKLWDSIRGKALILVDIPIGLPENSKRQCDVQARKLLKERASSVFPVPCRQAVYAATYEKACMINQKRLGVKLSVQTWNITGKILEVDDLLCKNKKARQSIRESHPEICFRALAGGRPMAHYKKNEQGFSERRNLLKSVNPATEKIADFALDGFLRKDLARDDILDAIVLAVSASAGIKALVSIPNNPPRDAMGLPMEITYSNPN